MSELAGVWYAKQDRPGTDIHLVLTEEKTCRICVGDQTFMEGRWSVEGDSLTFVADPEYPVDPREHSLELIALTDTQLELDFNQPPGRVTFDRIEALPASLKPDPELAALSREERTARLRALIGNFARLGGVALQGRMSGALNPMILIPSLETFRSDIPAEGLELLEEIEGQLTITPVPEEKIQATQDNDLMRVLAKAGALPAEGLPRLTEALSPEDFACYVYLIVTDKLDGFGELQTAINELFKDDSDGDDDFDSWGD